MSSNQNQRQKPNPKSFVGKVRSTLETPSAEEQALLDGVDAPQVQAAAAEVPQEDDESNYRELHDYQLPEEDTTTPAWVVLPSDLTLPPGKLVGFMRFRANLTDVAGKGDRHCILWNLSSADEKLALKRTRGDAMRTVQEMAKQMIRSIDGFRVDWTGAFGVGNVDKFWDEIGSRYRQQLVNYYIKTHSLGQAEQADFFANCIAIRTVG